MDALKACRERLTTQISTSSEAGMQRALGGPLARWHRHLRYLWMCYSFSQGIKRPGDDELDDSTASTRTGARLLVSRSTLCGVSAGTLQTRGWNKAARLPVNTSVDSSHTPAP